MGTHKFPDSLGGGEHKSVIRRGDEYGFDLPGVRDRLWLHISDLVEAKPPIPAEPEPGAYLIGDVLCVRFPADTTPGRWAVATDGLVGGYMWHRWEDAVDALGDPDVTIQRLVPAPPEVALPWVGLTVDGEQVIVHPRGGGPVPISAPDLIDFAPDVAEAMAYAILASAREAS